MKNLLWILTVLTTFVSCGLDPRPLVPEDFETDEVSTFGGLITMSLGRFPEKGENIYFKNQNLRVSVDEVGERMIKECTIKMEEPKQASDI